VAELEAYFTACDSPDDHQELQVNPSAETRWETIAAARVLSCDRLGGISRAASALRHKHQDGGDGETVPVTRITIEADLGSRL